MTDVNGIIFIINVAVQKSFEFIKELFPRINKSNTKKITFIIVVHNNNNNKIKENLVPIFEIENLSIEFKCPLFMVLNEFDDDINDAFFYIIKRISYQINKRNQSIKNVKKGEKMKKIKHSIKNKK